MDAYLICDATRKAMWLGKPIRPTAKDPRILYYHRGGYDGPYNHEVQEDNRVLWKFLAENGRHGVRVVFSGEYDEDSYEQVGSDEVETAEYLRGWPPK
jgi:hypothetical protein